MTTTDIPIQTLIELADAFEDLPAERQRELETDIDGDIRPFIHYNAITDPVFLDRVRDLIRRGQREQAMAWLGVARYMHMNYP